MEAIVDRRIVARQVGRHVHNLEAAAVPALEIRKLVAPSKHPLAEHESRAPALRQANAAGLAHKRPRTAARRNCGTVSGWPRKPRQIGYQLLHASVASSGAKTSPQSPSHGVNTRHSATKPRPVHKLTQKNGTTFSVKVSVPNCA